ncbi:MAG: polyamine aminopropyltransferase [bacterium]
MEQFDEQLYPEWAQSFKVEEVLFEHRTEHQHLVIFRNKRFGRVMALDGIIQTTEADEFVYHEMLAHVPLFAHGSAERVLIIGGGDGGLLREVVKHPEVHHITQVEIDAKVVEMAQELLPNHSQGAFDDPRLELVIQDGVDFVQSCTETFDVILSDSTDPVGPGEVLFTSPFYSGCKRLLGDSGVLATQNGVPYLQLDEVRTTYQRLTPLFRDVHFYGASVPTYVGGIMAFGWASENPEYRRQPESVLRRRLEAAKVRTRFYTPELHYGSFALPQYILESFQS